MMNEAKNTLMLSVYFELRNEYAKLPQKNNKTDVGYDLYASEPVIIAPKSTMVISTGIHMMIPFPGTFFKIEGRSGMAAKGIFPSGGIIDNDYRGEIKVVLNNFTDSNYFVNTGDRIAQLVPYKVEYDLKLMNYGLLSKELKDVMVNNNSSERGESGFGSSGR